MNNKIQSELIRIENECGVRVLYAVESVIPYAVGVDIACRMKMSVLDLPTSWLNDRKDRLAEAIEKEARFGVGSTFKDRRAHAVLDEDWSVSPVTAKNKERAWAQLGTSGSGNHFVEFGILTVSGSACGLEPGEYVALLSHSGIRGTGAAVCDHYSKLATSQHRELPKELSRLAWLSLDSADGQAIDVYTPQKAFCMMASGAAAGLDTSDGSMIPLLWEKWIVLPTEPGEEAAMTAKGPIRIPRVVIAVNYRFLRIKTEPLTHETIARRQDYCCAYSGRPVRRKNWSLDHVIPKSRGGSSSWDNLVIADKEVNNRKGDRTPSEAGLSLLHRPQAPRRFVPGDDIKRKFGILFREWEPFVSGLR